MFSSHLISPVSLLGFSRQNHLEVVRCLPLFTALIRTSWYWPQCLGKLFPWRMMNVPVCVKTRQDCSRDPFSCHSGLPWGSKEGRMGRNLGLGQVLSWWSELVLVQAPSGCHGSPQPQTPGAQRISWGSCSCNVHFSSYSSSTSGIFCKVMSGFWGLWMDGPSQKDYDPHFTYFFGCTVS